MVALAAPVFAQSRGDWNRYDTNRAVQSDQRGNQYSDQRGNQYSDRDNRFSDRDNRFNDRFVRGVVVRVDYRSRTLWVRDQRSGRLIAAPALNLRNLRRGDSVTLSGRWERGVFEVSGIR
jgi:hypothetical protein